MPIEINELHIKVSVNQSEPGGGEGSSVSVSETSAPKPGKSEKVIAEAIEQVLTILDNKKER